MNETVAIFLISVAQEYFIPERINQIIINNEGTATLTVNDFEIASGSSNKLILKASPGNYLIGSLNFDFTGAGTKKVHIVTFKQ